MDLYTNSHNIWTVKAMATVKKYKIRKYGFNRGRGEFIMRVPIEFMYNAKFPKEVRVEIDGAKMIITPA